MGNSKTLGRVTVKFLFFKIKIKIWSSYDDYFQYGSVPLPVHEQFLLLYDCALKTCVTNTGLIFNNITKYVHVYKFLENTIYVEIFIMLKIS